MGMVFGIVGQIMFLLGCAVFARAILTWFPIDRNGPIFKVLDAVTEPILDPLRRVIPTIGMVDLTPMVAIFILFTLSNILANA
jgi:YggT family protein